MVFAASSFGIDSGSIMSCSASYSGRRYGSIFSLSVPGRNPSRSPASTAGRVRMIRLTFLAWSACTALAIARYVLPVPAGPMPKVIVCLSIESTYRFWFSVFGRIERPRLLRMFRLSTSAGRSVVSARSMWSTRSTVSTVTPWPVRMIVTSSSRSRSARAISPGSPVSVTWLPRTCTSALNAFSRRARCSSPGPRRLTMLMLFGTTTTCLVLGGGLLDLRLVVVHALVAVGHGCPRRAASLVGDVMGERLSMLREGAWAPHPFAPAVWTRRDYMIT